MFALSSTDTHNSLGKAKRPTPPASLPHNESHGQRGTGGASSSTSPAVVRRLALEKELASARFIKKLTLESKRAALYSDAEKIVDHCG